MQLYDLKFDLTTKMKNLKTVLFFSLITFSTFAKAQKIDSIYVHLYTDSLKKGTYNYINIDGKLNNGRYLPLDTTDLVFTSSDGNFYGNSLYIPPDFRKEKVNIKAVLKTNPAIYKQFDIYIKKKPDPATLKTMDEILNEPASSSHRKRRI